MAQIFMSHTKLDEDCCDRFDRTAAREGIKVFRSEFEDIVSPPWKSIKEEINKSNALFLLIGKELVKAQAQSEVSLEASDQWKFTQNWISYEVGLASQKGIDVWVVCDGVDINFPVPYLDNYDVYGLISKENMKFYRDVFMKYNGGFRYERGKYDNKYLLQCVHVGCKADFNLWSRLKQGTKITCPSCLKKITLKKEWKQ